METLKQLRSLGLRISMDDFGTGYSSLNYLRSFPFDKIKIDRSFVKDVQNDEESRAIVQAITTLSTQFGLVTTAEGVETIEQLRYVSREGCTEVQGRLFSMPVPASEIPGLLRQLSALKSEN
jgi:EAL domain-containing protein (putative c-di-GMP-specific phosphodiesterase class I)